MCVCNAPFRCTKVSHVCLFRCILFPHRHDLHSSQKNSQNTWIWYLASSTLLCVCTNCALCSPPILFCPVPCHSVDGICIIHSTVYLASYIRSTRAYIFSQCFRTIPLLFSSALTFASFFKLMHVRMLRTKPHVQYLDIESTKSSRWVKLAALVAKQSHFHLPIHREPSFENPTAIANCVMLENLSTMTDNMDDDGIESVCTNEHLYVCSCNHNEC